MSALEAHSFLAGLAADVCDVARLWVMVSRKASVEFMTTVEFLVSAAWVFSPLFSFCFEKLRAKGVQYDVMFFAALVFQALSYTNVDVNETLEKVAFKFILLELSFVAVSGALDAARLEFSPTKTPRGAYLYSTGNFLGFCFGGWLTEQRGQGFALTLASMSCSFLAGVHVVGFLPLPFSGYLRLSGVFKSENDEETPQRSLELSTSPPLNLRFMGLCAFFLACLPIIQMPVTAFLASQCGYSPDELGVVGALTSLATSMAAFASEKRVSMLVILGCTVAAYFTVAWGIDARNCPASALYPLTSLAGAAAITKLGVGVAQSGARPSVYALVTTVPMMGRLLAFGETVMATRTLGFETGDFSSLGFLVRLSGACCLGLMVLFLENEF